MNTSERVEKMHQRALEIALGLSVKRSMYFILLDREDEVRGAMQTSEFNALVKEARDSIANTFWLLPTRDRKMIGTSDAYFELNVNRAEKEWGMLAVRRHVINHAIANGSFGSPDEGSN